MFSMTAFSHMVSLIYAAAVSPMDWDVAMAEIHRGFSQPHAGIVHTTALALADGASRSVVGTLLPTAEDTYDYYGHIDHVLQTVEHGPVGIVRTSYELITPYSSTEFCADWVRPNDIEAGLFVRLTDDVNPVSFIVAGSARGREHNTPKRLTMFRELVPHIQQALRTQRELTSLTERAENFSQTVDRLSHGIAIVTRDLQIVDCNAAAEQILSDRDGLRVSNGVLVASLPTDDRRLRGLAHQALAAEGVRAGGVMACQRISGQRSYVLHIVPLDPAAAQTGIRPVAMVLIIDPSRQPLPVIELMRQLYGLTKAEASVAHLVVNGEGVQAISDRLSLSSATVRTHLRAIFSKTGTHRQAELVRLLSTIIP